MKENEEEEAVVEVPMSEYIHFTRPEYLYYRDFNEEGLANFLGHLNATRETPKRTVYLDSGGGAVSCIHPVIDAIEEGQCDLIACNKIYSAAFMVFFATNVEKRILPGTIGMFHYPFIPSATLKPDYTINIGENKLDKLEHKLVVPFNKYFKELLGITKEKHKELLKGGELIYEYKDLVKLLKKSKELLAKYKK